MNKKELEKYLLDSNLNNIDSFEHLLIDTLATNEKFNLTAIKDEEKFRELMILDSLYPLHLLDFNDKKVIDVGTGGGYPGLPLALASKGDFTLLDSTKKKIDHINEYVKEKEKSKQIMNKKHKTLNQCFIELHQAIKNLKQELLNR